MKINKRGGFLFSFGFILFSVGVFFSAFSVAFAVVSPPITATVSPSKDAWIDEANPLSFFGTSTDIQVQSSGNANQRGLIAFDLSSIPANANITSAVMSLYLFIAPQSNRVYNLNDINDPTPWSETFLNWNNQPIINSTVVSSAPIASTSAGSFISWDVTSEVAKMVAGSISNQGWEIRDANENSTTSESKTSIFRAREYASTDITKIPYLTIIYTLPGTASISGTVWNDANDDGLLSAGEPGLSGWTVTLSGNSTSTTVTDGSGNYSFSSLPDGTYQVCETLASSTPPWMETAPAGGFGCGAGLFGYNVTISSSMSVTAENFGNVLSSTTPPVATTTPPVATTTPPTSTTTPSVPTLLSPTDASTVSPSGLSLSWLAVTVSASSSPVSYFYQIATSSATTTQNSFLSPVATSTALSGSQASVSGLADGTYFWQVQACDVNSNCSGWSDPFQFVLLTPAVTTVGSGGGGGGGNGPIAGSYGVVLTSENVSSNSAGGSLTNPVTTGSVASNGGNGGGESVLVPPETSGQSAPVVSQNSQSQNPVVAQNYPSTNANTENNNTSGSQTQSQTVTSTTSVTPQSTQPEQPQNNSNQTAAAVTSPGSSSSSFWIWAIIIVIVIGIVILVVRSIP
jgi:hypothetical protein